MTDFLGELFSLNGRVAVVTGGSSGIGEAMASALALAGAKVVLVARDPTRLSATSRSLCEAGCAAAWVSADLADRVPPAWYPLVVIKLGADGALFYANGRPPVRVPAPPVERVIDGTGAGDAFIARFLPAWLDKKPPMEALASGCRLAAHALNLIGARPILLPARGACNASRADGIRRV